MARGRSRRRKKTEFSKKILYVTVGVAIIIFAYAMWIQYLIISKDYHGDTSIVITLLTVIGAEITAGTSFYYYKARSENLLKIRKSFGEDVVDDIRELENKY